MKFSELRARLKCEEPGYWATGRRIDGKRLIAWRRDRSSWQVTLWTPRVNVRQKARTLGGALQALVNLVARCPDEFGLEPED